MDCRAFALSSSVFLFLQNTPYIFAPWNARSPREGKLAQVSVLVPDQLEDHANLGLEEDEIGTGALQAPWSLMRHQVRVKESQEPDSCGGKKSK